MSVEGREWADNIQARHDIPMRAKVVARVLGNRHNPRTGQCTPGQECIAEDAGTSIKTVRKALRDLEEAGTIERRARSKRDERGRTFHTYLLRPVDGAAPMVWEKHRPTGTHVPVSQDGPTGSNGTTYRNEKHDLQEPVFPDLQEPVFPGIQKGNTKEPKKEEVAVNNNNGASREEQNIPATVTGRIETGGDYGGWLDEGEPDPVPHEPKNADWSGNGKVTARNFSNKNNPRRRRTFADIEPLKEAA